MVYGHRIQKVELAAGVLSYAGLGIVFVQDVPLNARDALIGGVLVLAGVIGLSLVRALVFGFFRPGARSSLPLAALLATLSS